MYLNLNSNNNSKNITNKLHSITTKNILKKNKKPLLLDGIDDNILLSNQHQQKNY
jgi:hypothetical protein